MESNYECNWVSSRGQPTRFLPPDPGLDRAFQILTLNSNMLWHVTLGTIHISQKAGGI
jgi:hypothetical protein